MKLLLVEDEMELVNFLKRGFRYEGFFVDCLGDGKNVVSEQEKNNYDVIILDLMLPTVNGDEVLKNLRNSGDITPVIVLTAINDIETKTKILNLGADDYLIKPFSFVELVARVKTVYRRSQGSMKRKNDIRVGNLTLSPQTHTVTWHDKTIRLRLKEYTLLEYFMRNPNMVISREMLVENVWKYDAKLQSNAVDSHVSLLRKKLNGAFNKKFIETVYGVGYMLRSEIT